MVASRISALILSLKSLNEEFLNRIMFVKLGKVNLDTSG